MFAVGGLNLDASTRSTDDLVRIVFTGKGNVILKG